MKKWFFIVKFDNGLKNAEWNLTKTAAKALYDYHVKNSAVLGINHVQIGEVKENNFWVNKELG